MTVLEGIPKGSGSCVCSNFLCKELNLLLAGYCDASGDRSVAQIWLL